MYIHIYTYLHEHIYAYTHIRIYACTYIRMYTYMHFFRILEIVLWKRYLFFSYEKLHHTHTHIHVDTHICTHSHKNTRMYYIRIYSCTIEKSMCRQLSQMFLEFVFNLIFIIDKFERKRRDISPFHFICNFILLYLYFSRSVPVYIR